MRLVEQRSPRTIVVYGKGGVGKSTVASHLATSFAARGLKTLVVGCDPKVDTSSRLMGSDVPPTTLLDLVEQERTLAIEALLMHAPSGVDVVETGGAGPGAGCAGHGVATMCKLLARERPTLRQYDVVLFDVLGDLVCGGFVAPLRSGLADTVCFVSSEESASLFAANSLAAVVRKPYCETVRVGGIIFNVRDPSTPREHLGEFAARVGLPMLAVLQRDPDITAAERSGRTAVEVFPDAPISRQIGRLADTLLDPLSGAPASAVTPLSLETFWKLVRQRLP